MELRNRQANKRKHIDNGGRETFKRARREHITRSKTQENFIKCTKKHTSFQVISKSADRFPPYAISRKLFDHLNKRYHTLMGNCLRQNIFYRSENISPTFGDVHLVAIQEDGKDDLTKLLNTPLKDANAKTITKDVITITSSKLKAHTIQPNVILACAKDKTDALEYYSRKLQKSTGHANTILVLVKPDNGEAVNSQTGSVNDFPDDMLASESRPEDLQQTIGYLLERLVFKHLKVTATKLQRLLQDDTLSSNLVGIEPEDLPVQTRTAMIERHKQQQSVVNPNYIAIKQLLSEIIGAFCRSDVPDCDIPANIDESEEEKKKLLDKIMKVAKGNVISCCYRLGVLSVFLDETSKKKVKTTEATVQKIRNLLQKHKFHENEYEIVFVSKVSSYTKCEVGSKIDCARKLGTAGGFATCKYPNQTKPSHSCLLTARHVLTPPQHSDGIVNYAAGRYLGRIMEPSHLDIGAVEVAVDVVARFKLSSNEEASCRLFNFRSSKQRTISGLIGQSVYIFGAVSSPGYGKITSTEMSGMNEYILVEDVQKDDGRNITPFSNNGDSGAIVCADSKDKRYVEVIGMLSGPVLTTCKEVQATSSTSDNTSKTRYNVLKLQVGLEELSSIYKARFILCGELDESEEAYSHQQS